VTDTLKSSAPHIYDPVQFADLADWGTQPNCTAGPSKSSGRLLFKGPNNEPEVGLWVCTPGAWPLSIPRDEFCHFIAGRATYTSDTGQVIEVRPGTCVHFHAGWTGTCVVHETMRNLYMLR